MNKAPSTITASLPAVYSVNDSHDGNSVQQVLVPQWTGAVEVAEYENGRLKGYLLDGDGIGNPVAVMTNGAHEPFSDKYLLTLRGLTVGRQDRRIDLSSATWARHPAVESLPTTAPSFEERVTAARKSWPGRFEYQKEDPSAEIPGLRPPQIGAVHAALGHFSVHKNPATLVMPTGTGKTEAMLAILVAAQCERLLVVVPTDALRTQIADKFLSLGILRQCGVVAETALNPIVGILKRRPKTKSEVDAIFGRCNVIVATMAGIGQCSEDLQQAMAAHCSHLFIDEAHHVGAPTWEAFKKCFAETRILQFTATPYRNDERPVGEQVIFVYSLRQAQQDGYFRPIDFKPVREFDPKKRDAAIAEAAVSQLRADLSKGHILMARVSGVKRAEEVFKLYSKHAEFKPVQIHTGIKSMKERARIREQILSGKSRVVVCVDMLGEGFDLPELKIAAFHDVRRSLPVTLQLAGRFTRAKPGLGNATVIANIADVEVGDELRKLYRRDGDWNALLPHFSDKAIKGEIELGEFIAGFKSFPEDVSLHNVRPAMSTVAYRTECESWNPEEFSRGIPGFDTLDRVYHDVNPTENTLVILTARRAQMEWARVDEIYSWDWQLYILFWHQERQLLFIHNSSNKGFFRDLAKAVAGKATPIRGAEIFRCLATVNRLRLQNVGLIETLGRLIRFTMRAGSDVEGGLSEAQKRKAIKSNLFGTGFEDGHRTSIGCSYKGRIWSRQTTNLREFTRWCRSIGNKLLDESLDPEQVLRGTLQPRLVSARPAGMPIAAEWPEAFYTESETAVQFQLGTESFYLHEVDIEIEDPSEEGPLRIAIACDRHRAVFELELSGSREEVDFQFKQRSVGDAKVTHSGHEMALAELLTATPPAIWFADGSSLRGNELVELRHLPPPFPQSRVEVWNWTGVDIRRESQGPTRKSDTIQFRVIEELKARDFKVIFDDDGSGEAADVVGIRETESSVDVEFWHCKFSGGQQAGARVKDLYELCGQAQRSVRWMQQPTELFLHLMRREKARKQSRFELGTEDDLDRIIEKSRLCPVTLGIVIVQPGVSKAAISAEQLQLLAVTENYLIETFKVGFSVVASS